MKIRMLKDYILIREIPDEDKFGIKSDLLSVRAKVIHIGPDVSGINVDDIVYLSKYSGIEYEDMRIVKPHEVLGYED